MFGSQIICRVICIISAAFVHWWIKSISIIQSSRFRVPAYLLVTQIIPDLGFTVSNDRTIKHLKNSPSISFASDRHLLYFFKVDFILHVWPCLTPTPCLFRHQRWSINRQWQWIFKAWSGSFAWPWEQPSRLQRFFCAIEFQGIRSPDSSCEQSWLASKCIG